MDPQQTTVSRANAFTAAGEKGDGECFRDQHDQDRLVNVVVTLHGSIRPLDARLATTTSSQTEKKLIRKLDRWILPFISLLYLCAYLDRGSIGNARLQGLQRDVLDNDDGKYAWAVSIFYFGYVVFEVPANLMLRAVRPGTWLSSTMIAWGTISTLTSVVHNYAGILALRFFLGMGEAAFAPGIPLYLSMWYTRDELGIRNGIWLGSSALAGAFGGLIAYGVSQIKSSIPTWKFLFIIEGVPSVLLGVLALFILPNRPESTKGLSPDERALALERVSREVHGGKGEGHSGIRWRHVKNAVTDGRTWVKAVVYTGLNVSLSSISVFLPTLIRDLGYSDANAQLLTVAPYAAAYVVLLTTCYTSDRTFDRGLHITFLSAVGAGGYLMLALASSSGARFAGTFLATAGVFPCIPLCITWVSNNSPTETRRAIALAMMVSLAQAFSVLGTHIYPDTEAPRFFKGQMVCFGFMCLSSAAAFALHLWLRYENHVRDVKYGKVERKRKGKLEACLDEKARSADGEKGVVGTDIENVLKEAEFKREVAGGSSSIGEEDEEVDAEDSPTFRFAT